MNNLFSIFVAYGFVWLLHVGYLLSLAARQNSLRQEITTLKAMIEQGTQVSGGR
jgi:CcmD family protein